MTSDSTRDNNSPYEISGTSIDGQLTSNDTLSDVVCAFPQDEIVYAFGYGSGVFSQHLSTSNSKGGILDIILVVKDAVNFHNENLQRHPHHYASWLRASGASTAAWMQRDFWLKDARVLFHVVDDPVPMKYGVVHQDDLYSDLTNWDCLYLAGRLHKPTLPILKPPDPFLDAQRVNLRAAVAAALLLLSLDDDSTSIMEIAWPTFYTRIASLSYTGDFRMQIGGEDPMKITKLVHSPGQLQRFHSLYRDDALQPLQQLGILDLEGEDRFRWNSSDLSARRYLWQQLPPRIRPLSPDVNALAKGLAAIVSPAARNQSFKGIFTLGFRKSIQYAGAKLSKGIFRRS